MSRITENQLILPTLYLLHKAYHKTLYISTLKKELTKLLRPTGEDAERLNGRSDTKFDQKVGNLHVHRTLEDLSYVTYTPRGAGDPSGSFTLTAAGEEHLHKSINIDHLIIDPMPEASEKKGIFSDAVRGDTEYKLSNILFKGVPGTGKSRTIDSIIENKLGLDKNDTNVLRINIHSASSNADLMQGIGISSENGQIAYKEKQGLVLNIIKQATYKPKQPFVLVLEEIQENSLNELIGDLIYLIEPSKRAAGIPDNSEYTYKELVEKIIADTPATEYVEIPYLIENSTEYRKMIMPENLYVFCTSNYREDKKVIEDNLLRRFDVIEIYPQYGENYADGSNAISEFLKVLNARILIEFKNEVHPDRFQIGHSNWLGVEENAVEEFYKSLLKVVIEFKEVKEIEYKPLRDVLKDTSDNPALATTWVKAALEDLDIEKDYTHLLIELQNKVYNDDVFATTP